MIDPTEQLFIQAVYRLSRAGNPFSIETVATAAGLTATESTLALIRLGRAGLIDSNRMRLTMQGLVAAAQLERGKLAVRRARIHAQAWLRTRTASWLLFAERTRHIC